MQLVPENLAAIRLFLDEKHPPPENMAVDEALLTSELRPVLRFYDWSRQAVSLGYFCALESARVTHGESFEYVRRWTGGGTVEHGSGDATYTLVLPGSCTWGRCRASVLYHRVHSILAEALKACDVQTDSFKHASNAQGGACFQNPVSADLLVGGEKIAGAAIRRCARGILLQGSIQGIDMPIELPRVFAGMLAREVERWHPGATLDGAVKSLIASRYGNDAWTARK